MKQYVIAFAAVIAIVGTGYYFLAIRRPSYATATVERGPITQEVPATGNVETPSTIDLKFQDTGKLAFLRVKIGDKVSAGRVLAGHDTSVLQAQLKQAQASVAAQKAQLATIEEGTRPEQIAVTQVQVASDEVALAQANQGLTEAVKGAYTAADSAVEHAVDGFFHGPSSSNPQVEFSLGDSQLEGNLESDRLSMQNTLSAWQKDIVGLSAASELDPRVTEAQNGLSATAALLSESGAALDKATATPQASQEQIDAWTAGVAAARGTVDAAISALTTAVSAQKKAASTLARDQKTLELEQAGSTASAIAAGQAQVDAARANVAVIQSQLSQMELVTPIDGTVTDVVGEVGETIPSGAVVISILPNSKLRVNANLSEDNVGGVKVGQPVRIMLDAFPNITWDGAVANINPAQTIVNGAVYYKTAVTFDAPDERLKPGLTANVWIQTGAASSTLIVPAGAIKKNGGNTYVRVLKAGTPVDQDVTTGLKSRGGKVEIVQGLNEGEQVLVGTQ